MCRCWELRYLEAQDEPELALALESAWAIERLTGGRRVPWDHHRVYMREESA